jgi:hypothetical protein
MTGIVQYFTDHERPMRHSVFDLNLKNPEVDVRVLLEASHFLISTLRLRDHIFKTFLRGVTVRFARLKMKILLHYTGAMSERKVDLTNAYELSEIAGYVGALMMVKDICDKARQKFRLDNHSPIEEFRLPQSMAESIASQTLASYLHNTAQLPNESAQKTMAQGSGLFTQYAHYAIGYLEDRSPYRDQLQSAGFESLMPTLHELTETLTPKYSDKLHTDGIKLLVPVLLSAQSDYALWSIDSVHSVSTLSTTDLPEQSPAPQEGSRPPIAP